MFSIFSAYDVYHVPRHLFLLLVGLLLLLLLLFLDGWYWTHGMFNFLFVLSNFWEWSYRFQWGWWGLFSLFLVLIRSSFLIWSQCLLGKKKILLTTNFLLYLVFNFFISKFWMVRLSCWVPLQTSYRDWRNKQRNMQLSSWKSWIPKDLATLRWVPCYKFLLDFFSLCRDY